jgi:hypothetical protein
MRMLGEIQTKHMWVGLKDMAARQTICTNA